MDAMDGNLQARISSPSAPRRPSPSLSSASPCKEKDRDKGRPRVRQHMEMASGEKHPPSSRSGRRKSSCKSEIEASTRCGSACSLRTAPGTVHDDICGTALDW